MDYYHTIIYRFEGISDNNLDEDPDAEVPSLNISFNVKEPIGEIKVTNAKPKELVMLK